MTLDTIKAKFEAVNLKAGFIVAFKQDRHGSTHVEVKRNGLLFWRAWSFETDFEFDLNRVIELATEVKEVEPVAVLPRRAGWTRNGNVKIVTHAGMILIASLSDVQVSSVSGLKSASWLMRLNLIENLRYPAEIQAEDIKTIEYIA